MGRTVGRTAAEGYEQTTANYESEKIKLLSTFDNHGNRNRKSRNQNEKQVIPVSRSDPKWVACVSCAPELCGVGRVC